MPETLILAIVTPLSLILDENTKSQDSLRIDILPMIRLCARGSFGALVCVFSHKVLTQKTHPARFTHKDGSDCILTQVGLLQQECGKAAYFIASSIATATATVAPTIGLLPMPT